MDEEGGSRRKKGLMEAADFRTLLFPPAGVVAGLVFDDGGGPRAAWRKERKGNEREVVSSIVLPFSSSLGS